MLNRVSVKPVVLQIRMPRICEYRRGLSGRSPKERHTWVESLAYEIEQEPHLVQPAAEAFDGVNVDKTNIAWLDASDIA